MGVLHELARMEKEEAKRQDNSYEYGWIITKDHLFNPDYDGGSTSRIGTMGPHDIPDDIANALRANSYGKLKVRHWKAYDDDGELYYEGKYISRSGELDEMAFSPLEDFCMPDSGCTEIRYKMPNGKWETL